MPLIFTLLERALLLPALLSAAVCSSIALMIKSPMPQRVACEAPPARRCNGRVKSLLFVHFFFFLLYLDNIFLSKQSTVEQFGAVKRDGK